MYNLKVLLMITLLTNSTILASTEVATPGTNTLKPFSDDSYIFTWNIDEAADLINITLDCATIGWVGFGISDTGLMPNSDLVICYITADSGIATCNDGYANGNTFSKDESMGGSSDINKVVGYISNSRTNISFSKKLTSKDTYDKQIVKGAAQRVLFSYRTEGNPSTEDGQFNEYSIQIAKNIVLWPNDDQLAMVVVPDYRINPDVRKMPIGVYRLPLPAQKTFYACRYFNIKNLAQNITQMQMGRSYHAIAFEALTSNTKRFKHMEIRSCKDPSQVRYTIEPFDCTDLIDRNCSNYISWTPNSGDIVLPPEAGIMWGSYDTEAIMLRIHYNNDDLIEDEIDTSNFMVYFTANLRPNDVGLMTLGRPESEISIPPGQKSYDVIGTCPIDCSIAAKGDITVFGYTPYGHILMTKLVTNIVNGDKSLITLQEDPFDFTKQKFIQQNPPIVLTPGFKATTTCTYDTSAKTSITEGGLNSDDETCYNFVMYYPKENGLSLCIGGEAGNACVNNVKFERNISGYYIGISYLLILLVALLVLF
jgi:hypothetical protein